MDFAYVVNGKKNKNEFRLVRIFYLKVAPKLVAVPPALGDLESILKWIDKALPNSEPVGKAVFIVHGLKNSIELAMTPAGGVQTSYEELVDAVRSSTPFLAPISFRSAPGPHIVIGSCLIGENKAFLLLLKKYLGGSVTVTAPRHTNVFSSLLGNHQDVIIDYLKYTIEVNRAVPITSHAELVSAFLAEPNRRYDGSHFPAKEIEALLGQLPKPKKLSRKYLPNKNSKQAIERRLWGKVSFNEPVAGLRTHGGNRFVRFEARKETLETQVFDDKALKSKTLPERLGKYIDDWDRNYKNASDVSWSFSQEIGLKADEDPIYINWSIEEGVDKETKVRGHRMVGVFYKYRLIFPIASVGDGTLLFDSRVVKGPALTTPTTWPNDPEHLAALFRTV